MGKDVESLQKKKKSLKPNAASHRTASWCTDADGFLGHSPLRGSLSYKGPTLQKIILGFVGSLLIHYPENILVSTCVNMVFGMIVPTIIIS